MDIIETTLDGLYRDIKRYRHEHNCQVLYNIIALKTHECKESYHQPLYVDIKKFIKSYIHSLGDKDCGYDNLNINKITEVTSKLSTKQELDLLNYAKRILKTDGYWNEIDDIDKRINKLYIKRAKENKQFFEMFRLLISSNVSALVLTLVGYTFIVTILLLPAPYPWMVLFDVQEKVYVNQDFINSWFNTVIFMTGNSSIQPIIQPVNCMGVIVYAFIIALLYFFIINFILRKVEYFFNN